MKKFLAMGLLSLFLLFAGCTSESSMSTTDKLTAVDFIFGAKKVKTTRTPSSADECVVKLFKYSDYKETDTEKSVKVSYQPITVVALMFSNLKKLKTPEDCDQLKKSIDAELAKASEKDKQFETTYVSWNSKTGTKLELKTEKK